MKRTLLTTALLVGISGLATAATSASADGFVVEATHPHDDTTKAEARNVWVQKVSDGEHMYELHMDGGEMIVIVDGDTIPEKQIKKDGNAVIVMEDDGGVIYEFNIALSTDGPHGVHSGENMFFAPSGDAGQLIEIVASQDGDKIRVQGRPKVMLGVYTGEPGDSLREHLGIKGNAILVEKVIKGLSADKAGIKDHDIIISIDGSDGVSGEELTKLLGEHNPGDEIKVVVLRKGQKMKLNTELFAYNAKALGHDMAPATASSPTSVWTSKDSQVPNRFFSQETRQLTHEKIIDALREKGISEKKIKEIEEQIRSSLDENVWSNFGHDGKGGVFVVEQDGDGHGGDHRVFAELMERKAEGAMRDAERLTMEYKDGQLLLKSHAEGLADHLHTLEERLHESMPKIEAEFGDRLEELEGRLEELEDMLDQRMDRLSGLIEHLIQRLEED